MKAIVSALAVAMAVAFPALAQDAHHPDQQQRLPAGTNAPTAQAPATLGASATPAAAADATVKKLQDNTRRMQAQLEQIAKAKGAAERQKLIAQHLQTMHESMLLGRMLGGPTMDCIVMEGGAGMMGQGMMGPGMMGPGMMGPGIMGGGGMMAPGAPGGGGMAGQSAPGGAAPMPPGGGPAADEMMIDRMQQMERRMDMMQMMLEQMNRALQSR